MTNPVYVDHADLSAYTATAQANAVAAPAANLNQRFWASPVRPVDSSVTEVLEITLASPRLVNRFSFDLSRFPHVWALEYYDDDRQVWSPACDEITGAPLQAKVLQSVPAVLPKLTDIPGHLHPQHSYQGHWDKIDLALQPVTASHFRLLLTRTRQGHAPRDSFGQLVDYSLAVAAVDIGYRVDGLDKVPRAPRRSDTVHAPFASTTDLLDSTITFALRQNRADLIAGNDSEVADFVWRSEGQPYPDAVVCFYADLRDELGRPQVVDRIYIDPLTSGPHVSLYYCERPGTGGFDGRFDALDADTATPHNEAQVASDALRLDGTGYVTVDNTYLHYDPSQPWWLGLSVRPNYASFLSDSSGALTDADGNIVFDTTQAEHTLFDCGAWRVALVGGGILFATQGGDQIFRPFFYDVGQLVTLVVSCDGPRYRLHALAAGDEQTGEIEVANAIAPGDYPVLYVGSNVAQDSVVTHTDGSESIVSAPTLFADVVLQDLVLKEEVLPDEQFLSAPDDFSGLAAYPDADLPQTHNTLLRFDGSKLLLDVSHPTGLVGGPGAKFEAQVWTPIAREYRLHRGWMHLPPIRAAFIKFEITHLVPEYRDIYQPITMTAKKFPQSVLDAFDAEQDAIEDGTSQYLDGLPAQMIQPTVESPDPSLYLGPPSIVSTGGTYSGVPNTEVYVALDHAVGERLFDQRGEAWNYREWHPGFSAPRFTEPAVHVYRTEQVTTDLKVVYYAGLRRIGFARQGGTGNNDSEQYDDDFQDTANLASSSWIYDQDRRALTSGDGTRVSALSTVFPSQRALRGLQFATQQSHARQVLDDPEFKDPTLSTWTMIGDAQVPQELVTSDLFGTLLPVSRDSVASFWADAEALYPTWDDITTRGLDYADLSHREGRDDTQGGVASEIVAQPAGGRFYAAARVISQDDLSSPLYVQIVDAHDPGHVLAEEQIDVKANQVAEWYCGYTVGDGGQVINDPVWDDLTGGTTSIRPTLHDTFTRADAPSLGRMNSGQYWTGDNPLHIVSNTAQVTTLGQQSDIAPQSDWGTMSVTFGTTVTTTSAGSSVPLIGLGGSLHLMNDGRILDRSTGAVVTTITRPTAGDVYSFQFCPTRYLDPSQVPSGVDPMVTPWAIVISRNGSALTTLCRAVGYLQTKSLLGQVGQSYTGFDWVPSYQGLFGGKTIFGLPMPTDGAYDPGDATHWTTSEGDSWTVTQPFTFSQAAASGDYAHTATANWSSLTSQGRIRTDTGALYGTWEFRVNQLAPTIPPSSYWLAFLDDSPNPIGLRADGRLARADGTAVTASPVVPGITDGDVITIKLCKLQDVSPAVLSTWGIDYNDAGGPQSQYAIFLRNGTIVGKYNYHDVWSTPFRSLVGYTDGTNFSVLTGFTWTPEPTVAGDVRAMTWDSVSQNETLTWDAIGRRTLANQSDIQVRLVQKVASRNTFFVDTLSLFFDPIVWEFSNDGGASFTKGFGIRNNPDGVLLFDAPNPTDPAPVNNRLVYRVSGYGPDAWVSHLTIRPWYTGYPRDVPPRPLGQPHGPNVDTWEHYPPIEKDPRFQTWSKPVPRNWWFAFRNLDPQPEDSFVVPVITDNVVVL